MSIIVGVTGGIGSGKSTVCNVFKLLGIPVFEADKVAKQLLDSKLKEGLIRLFGEDICSENGNVDRKKLAKIIFNDEVQLEKMNKLVHPVVREDFEKWVTQNDKNSYVIHEAAILFESGFYKIMDYTILVSAPREQRIKWVKERDGVSQLQVEERMKNQFSDKEKQKLADIVLLNDNHNLLIPKILEIDKNLKEHGKIW